MMSDRNKILDRIRKNKPKGSAEMPSLNAFGHVFENDLEAFKSKLEKGGATVILSDLPTLESKFVEWENQNDVVIFAPTYQKVNGEIDAFTNKEQLKLTQLAILEAKVGVAENGAMWLDESNFPHRSIPFISQDLIVIIEAQNLVSNMHQAYQKINIADTGYGVFISGPSKTADIEQSLVIGAHGAKSLQVYIIS